MITDLDFLTGVRVVDLSQYESAPACTETLAWLGAEVVKVENPGRGDPGRSSGAAPGQDGHWFQQWNANKKSVTVDLKAPAGLALVKDLVTCADVFVENFRPGGIEALELGYDVLSTVNPRLIYAQLKGFAEGSPFAGNLAFDTIGQAAGGSFSVTGESGSPPVKPGPTVADAGAGMLLAITILAALHRQRETGRGAHLRAAMQDSVMHYLRGAFSVTARTGQPAPRNGARSPGVVNVPSNVYPCRPGGTNDWVYIYPSRHNPLHWTRLLEVIERQELVTDPRFDTADQRARNEAELDVVISEWTRRHDKHEAARRLSTAGIPASAVFDTQELLEDPSFVERGVIQEVPHPVIGAFRMLTWPVSVDGSYATLRSAPALGADTEEVLGEWLELSETELSALQDRGAFGSADRE